MPAEISVGIDQLGRPVAIKQGFDAVTRDRIAQEGTVLAFAQQPGVVELAAVDEANGQLSTLWAPGGSLESTTPDLPTSIRILATVAGVLADLHERGIVHGRVQPGHILLGSNSEAWLTGFAEASLDGSADRLVDLRGLASVIDHVLARHRLGPRSVPARPSTGHRPSSLPARLVTDLQMIARRAEQPPGEPRCSMHEVARLLRETAELAKAAPSPRSPMKRSSRRMVGIAAVAAGVAVVGLVLLSRDHSKSATAAPVPADATEQSGAVVPDSPVPDSPVPESTVPESTVADTPIPEIAPAATTTVVPICAEGATSSSIDVNGDGCPDAVSIEQGLVTVGEERYRLSTEPNDQVLVADWDCDGKATPAILRTRTGSIEVFDDWATADTPATARPVAIDPSVVMLRSSGGQCPELAATRTDGTSEPVMVTP